MSRNVKIVQINFYMKILDFKKIKDEGLVLTGTIYATQESNEKESKADDVIFIKDATLAIKMKKEKMNDYMVEGDKEPLIVMFRDRIGIIYQKGSLTKHVGSKISFKIEDIQEPENGPMIVYASLRTILEARRDKAIEKLKKAKEDGKTIKAKIDRITDNTAYLSAVNGTFMILRQKDFSKDWTPIRELYKPGDTLDVVLSHISDKTKRIFVKMPELYCAERMGYEEFIEKYPEGTSLIATVLDVQPNCCFVRVAPGVDMLCPVPDSFSPEKGMTVTARINQDRAKEDGTFRVRGRVVSEVNNDKYILDCVANNSDNH